MSTTQSAHSDRLAVSTWSLHRTLGRLPNYGPEANGTVPARAIAPDALSLLALPARLAAFGLHKVAILTFTSPAVSRPIFINYVTPGALTLRSGNC